MQIFLLKFGKYNFYLQNLKTIKFFIVLVLPTFGQKHTFPQKTQNPNVFIFGKLFGKKYIFAQMY